MLYNIHCVVGIQDDDTLLPAINTLPVISEDEEDEMSDDGEEDVKPLPTVSKLPGDEEESEQTEHSSTSPLLNKFPARTNFPNGDIIGGLRYGLGVRFLFFFRFFSFFFFH